MEVRGHFHSSPTLWAAGLRLHPLATLSIRGHGDAEPYMLILSVYMPNDAGNKTLVEYEETLNCISDVLANHQAQNIIIAGDLNTDFNRKLSSKQHNTSHSIC